MFKNGNRAYANITSTKFLKKKLKDPLRKKKSLLFLKCLCDILCSFLETAKKNMQIKHVIRLYICLKRKLEHYEIERFKILYYF